MENKEDYKTIRSVVKEEKMKSRYVAEGGIVAIPDYSEAETYTFEIIADDLLVITALLKRRALETEIPNMTDFANCLNGHLAAVRAHVDSKTGEFKLDHCTNFKKGDLSPDSVKVCWDHLQWVVNVYSQSFESVYEDEWSGKDELKIMNELLDKGWFQPYY